MNRTEKIRETLVQNFRTGGVNEAEEALRRLRQLAGSERQEAMVITALSRNTVSPHEQQLGEFLGQLRDIERSTRKNNAEVIERQDTKKPVTVDEWMAGVARIGRKLNEHPLEHAQSSFNDWALAGKQLRDQLDVLSTIKPGIEPGAAYGHVLQALGNAHVRTEDALRLLSITSRTELEGLVDRFYLKPGEAELDVGALMARRAQNDEMNPRPDLQYQVWGGVVQHVVSGRS